MRFNTVDDLPPGLREQARAQLQGLPKPVLSCTPVALIGVDHGRGDLTTEATIQRDACGKLVFADIKAKPRRSKYGAVPTTVDGIRFDSKREAKYYEQLKLRMAAGEVLFFLRQVPFHLPGGTKLVVDFLEFHADGSVHVVDAKGRETQTFRVKRREVEHHYPIKVELV